MNMLAAQTLPVLLHCGTYYKHGYGIDQQLDVYLGNKSRLGALGLH